MNKNEKIIYSIIIILFLILSSSSIYSSIQSYKFRRLYNTTREQLIEATDTNRRLEETIEECEGITAELESTVGRNISTAREAIDLLEQIRTEIGQLENSLYNRNSNNDYYDTYDKLYGLQ